MNYVLPDEPRGAVRPALAVSALWPLVTLMVVGPLVGFAWLAFNSWALGCRHAGRHTAMAVVAVVVAGVLMLAIARLDGGLVPRLLQILVHAAALCLAYWMMISQDDAEQWRKTFGPPLGNGLPPFVALLVLRLLGGPFVPETLAAFSLWPVA